MDFSSWQKYKKLKECLKSDADIFISNLSDLLIEYDTNNNDTTSNGVYAPTAASNRPGGVIRPSNSTNNQNPVNGSNGSNNGSNGSWTRSNANSMHKILDKVSPALRLNVKAPEITQFNSIVSGFKAEEQRPIIDAVKAFIDKIVEKMRIDNNWSKQDFTPTIRACLRHVNDKLLKFKTKISSTLQSILDSLINANDFYLNYDGMEKS